MAFIPPVSPSQQTYSRLRRQGNRKVLNTESITDSKNQDTLLGRRRKGDRRKRKLKVLFNRRKVTNRRNKQFLHRSTTIKDTKKAQQQKGTNINTTA